MTRRLAALGICIALLVPASASAQSGTIEPVGTMPILAPNGALTGPPDGSLIVNSVASRAYQVFRLRTERFAVRSFDLDTLQPVGLASYPGRLIPATLISGEFLYAIDEESNRLFFAVYDTLGFGIVVVDGNTLGHSASFSRIRAMHPPFPEVCTALRCVPSPPGIIPILRGMRFVSGVLTASALLLLMEEPKNVQVGDITSQAGVVWIAQWDATTGRQDWIHRIAACAHLGVSPGSRYALGLFQSDGPFIFVACRGRGGVGQVVRLPQDATSRPIPYAEQAFTGPHYPADALADPVGNRMLLRVVGEEGEQWWVFDGERASYEGILRATEGAGHASAGLDETRGRLYVLAPPTDWEGRSDPGGLLVADIRGPGPRFARFPQFAAPGAMRIVTDPPTLRVFVLPHGAAAYEVYADHT